MKLLDFQPDADGQATVKLTSGDIARIKDTSITEADAAEEFRANGSELPTELLREIAWVLFHSIDLSEDEEGHAVTFFLGPDPEDVPDGR